MKKTHIYRIWDKINKEYVTLGNFTKKHTWLVFPKEAIKENKLSNEKFEVHQFDNVPSKKFDLNKNEII